MYNSSTHRDPHAAAASRRVCSTAAQHSVSSDGRVGSPVSPAAARHGSIKRLNRGLRDLLRLQPSVRVLFWDLGEVFRGRAKPVLSAGAAAPWLASSGKADSGARARPGGPAVLRPTAHSAHRLNCVVPGAFLFRPNTTPVPLLPVTQPLQRRQRAAGAVAGAAGEDTDQ